MDLQVVSEDEGAGAMKADDGAAPIVDSSPLPGVQGAEEGLADGEDDDEEGDGSNGADEGDGVDEDEEDDEETASDME